MGKVLTGGKAGIAERHTGLSGGLLFFRISGKGARGYQNDENPEGEKSADVELRRNAQWPVQVGSGPRRHTGHQGDRMHEREFYFIFFTPNFDATVDFYRKTLELPLIRSWDGPKERGVLLRAGTSGVVCIMSRKPDQKMTPPQDMLIGIEVEDVDDWHRWLILKNVPIERPPQSHSWGLRTMSVKDPNGLSVLLFSRIGQTSPPKD
jgi:catechol 2,3-dioxygenase-like lactoylglutathione lyase family enzyme